MSDAELLKSEMDVINPNEKIDSQEIEEFLQSDENLWRLGEALNWATSPELLWEFEGAIRWLCDKILTLDVLTDNQKAIVRYFVEKFWASDPDMVDKLQHKLEWISDIEEWNDELFSQIKQAIEDEINEFLKDPIMNLEALWINWKTRLNWKNLRRDIKKPDDVEKIDANNVSQYIVIPRTVPLENYEYIANNIKVIIKRHLEINPKYQSILWDVSAWMTLKGTVDNNEYLVNLYNAVSKSIKKNPDEAYQINDIVSKINKWDQWSYQYVHLWLNMYLNWKKENVQNKIIEKIFDKFPSTNPVNFLNVCDKDSCLWSLKDSYIQYWLQKENVLFLSKDRNWKDLFLLDFSKKNKFQKFLNRWGNLADSCTFDKAYKDTQDFYNWLKWLRIDESIPLADVVGFLSFQMKTDQKNKEAYRLYQKNLAAAKRNYDNAGWAQTLPVDPMVPSVGSQRDLQYRTEKKMSEDQYWRQVHNNSVAMEKRYAALLLKSKNCPKWRIQWISWSNLILDFSKWRNPDDIVRDSFGEKLSDSWDDFVYNLSYDWKAAAWSAVWMIAWIVASGASCFSWNVWAAAWAFTLASRGVNWITQETLNWIQYLVESISWERAIWWNQVKDLWDSFMLWIWAYEQVRDLNWNIVNDLEGKPQYQFIWWERFWSNLLFDYLGWVVMFWAFKALWPAFETIQSIKIAWKPLEFASKWLFLQNFGIDMPMNALHTWFDTYLWIWDPKQRNHTWSILYWHDKWQNSDWDEHYDDHNFWDALESMIQSIDEHLTFENQSQVFFNTLMYCWMLEAWQWFVGKIKTYMPVDRINKYEVSSRKFQEAQKNFISEISKKWLKLDKNFKLVDAKTKKPIKIWDPRFLEFTPSLIKLKGILTEHSKATQELIASERELSNDWSSTYWLLKSLWLLSDKQPPLNILKEKIIECKKQYEKAIESWDLRTAQQLRELILEHQSAQMVLISEFHPESLNNIGLSNEERIQKAKELLQSELTPEQERAILDAHNAQWDAYSLSIPELMAKSKILFRAWFTEAQVRILIENCICWKIKWVEKWAGEWARKGEELPIEQRRLQSNSYIEQIKSELDISWLEIREGMTEVEKANLVEKVERTLKFKDGMTLEQKVSFIEKISKTLEQLEADILNWSVDNIDFDPNNWTFRAYEWWFRWFIESLALEWKMDQNFLNNIKLTIDYMTKRIINVWESEPITLKEWESRLDIWDDLIKAMERHMINQWLDNPQYFNSHGFDHTILVHSLIIKVREWLKISADTIAKKYWLSTEKSEKLYNGLIELSAILHDFWYPRQDWWDKTTHATWWAELFYKELKPKFEDFIVKEIWLEAEVARDLSCDMYNAVCFHGADKVETHYVSRVEWLDSEWRLYGWTLVPRAWIITSENMKIYSDFQSYRVSYKSEWFREWVAWRYTWVIDWKLVEFESKNWIKWEIVKEEEKWKLVKLDWKDGKNPREISMEDARTAVQDWQETSKATAYSQAIELSVNWWTDIKVFTSQWEWKNGIEFKKIVDEKDWKIIWFERKIWDKVESLQDFLKGNDLLRIEGEWERWKKPQIEINVENQKSLNEQSLNQALWWLADLTIKTDKWRITYEKSSWKYYDRAWNEIVKEDLLNDYKIIQIEANVQGWKIIKVNDNAYEWRFLNENWDRGGAWLEYRSWDIKEDPLMSMIRIADNLDMAFNRLIPSQRNAIFLTTLYNLENGWKLAGLFQKMEKFNQWKKWKLKLGKWEQPPTESEIRELFENELDIDIYKIFEEEGYETDEGWSSNWQKQLKKKFNFEDYFKDWKFDLVKFKQELFNEIRNSWAIQSHVWDDILDMSYDLMAEGMIGSYSVRHMVWLRPIKNVDFKEWSVQIEVDMDIYFNSHISDKVVDEKWKDIYLVEYHIWREGTALDAEPNGWARIDSHIVDSKWNVIWNISSKWEVDYSPMFKDGVIKPEYEKYKDSPLLNKWTEDIEV